MDKHFLDLDTFNKSDLRKILSFAKKIKKNPSKYSTQLKNKTLGLFFEKQSTRTRLSFAVGIQKLGGNYIELDKKQIGFGSRESDKDILNVMAQYLDALMIRNNNHKKLINLANLNLLPIINGLTNYSHPCQILSDIFTIEEKFDKIEGLTISWIGDFNNVLTSLIQAAEIFKFKLNILVPKILYNKKNKIIKRKKLKYCFFYNNFDKGFKNVDCIMTDAWISMGEKNPINKIKLFEKFQVNNNIMKLASDSAIFMHCLPAHRNQEVTDSVIDSKQSVVLEQAKNRLYVQQSILCNIIKNAKK